MSILEFANIPSQFGLTILLFSLVLLAAPYFAGHDFGFLKVPKFQPSLKSKLKIFGPVLMISAILAHAPLLSKTNPDFNLDDKNGSPNNVSGWFTARWSKAGSNNAVTVPVAVVRDMKQKFNSDPKRAIVNCIFRLAKLVAKEQLDDHEHQFLNACYAALGDSRGKDYGAEAEFIATCFFAVAEYRFEHGLFDPFSDDNYGNDTTVSCVSDATSYEDNARRVVLSDVLSSILRLQIRPNSAESERIN